jgi:hypothetical protein
MEWLEAVKEVKVAPTILALGVSAEGKDYHVKCGYWTKGRAGA